MVLMFAGFIERIDGFVSCLDTQDCGTTHKLLSTAKPQERCDEGDVMLASAQDWVVIIDVLLENSLLFKLSE